jgi:hypothetical protein
MAGQVGDDATRRPSVKICRIPAFETDDPEFAAAVYREDDQFLSLSYFMY